MYGFLEDVHEEAQEDMNGRSKWPANNKLFDVDTKSPKLSIHDQDYFYQMIARLLFVAKRARLDIQLTVTFICTCASEPTNQDYGKLAAVIKYIREMIHLPLLIGWDKSCVLTWSVDAAFVVHEDIRSHTGAALTMGKGAILSLSTKQKINTKSSTEAELVGVDDAINFVVWSKLFFDWQFKDYNPSTPTSQLGKTNILLQDNNSAIKLERYGKRSSTKRTHHILIRYFFVTNKLQDKTLTGISYCPTKEMVSDYLSKLLQGSLFCTHCNVIMGIDKQDEAESFNVYKIQLACRKPSGCVCFLFFFYFTLCFILNQYFFYQPISLLSALCSMECVRKYLFYILTLGDPKCVPKTI